MMTCFLGSGVWGKTEKEAWSWILLSYFYPLRLKALVRFQSLLFSNLFGYNFPFFFLCIFGYILQVLKSGFIIWFLNSLHVTFGVLTINLVDIGVFAKGRVTDSFQFFLLVYIPHLSITTCKNFKCFMGSYWPCYF